MGKVWIVLACLAGCGSSGSSSGTPPPTTEQPDPLRVAPETPIDAAIDAATATAEPDHAVAPVAPPPACLAAGATMTAVNLRAPRNELRACFDTNFDSKADTCARWRRDTGALISVEPVFDVEATDATGDALVAPPVEFHSQDVNDDDHRLELVDNTAEVCSPDRACMRIKPLLAEGEEIAEVFVDGPYRAGAISIKSSDSASWRIEFWDVQGGRLRARQKLESKPDATTEVKLRMGSQVVIALITRDGKTRGVTYGLDGAPHGAFAQGARDLDLDRTVELGDAYVMVDAPEGKPYGILITSVTTGATLARISIPRTEELTLEALGTYVIAAQGGEQLRFDVIDPRARTSRTLIAPGC